MIAKPDRVARRLLAIGTASYQDGWSDISDEVRREVRGLQQLFLERLDYETCETIIDPTASKLATGVANWFRETIWGEDDLAVVYYTGHAVANASELWLITSEIARNAANTAPSANGFAKWIWGGEDVGCRHVLLILDTCHAGMGSHDAVAMAARLREVAGGQARGGEFHVIATARSIQQAATGWFVDGLHRIVDHRLVGLEGDEWLRPDAIVEVLNQMSGPEQTADISGRAEGEPRFFPNPGWDHRFRLGMRPEQQRRTLAQIQRLALRAHWSPRARGVSVDNESGWYFTGRTAALRELVGWLGRSTGGGRVVFGRPGSGKSALLARLAVLSDSDLRDRAEKAGALRDVPDDTLPLGPAHVDLAVHARAKGATEVLLELAAGLELELADGTDSGGLIDEVVRALAARDSRLVVIVDALDEADKPDELAGLLRFLVEGTSSLVLLVGVRAGDPAPGRLVRRLGGGFEPLDLDADQYRDAEGTMRDVERYVRDREGSPYGDASAPELRDVAEAVARRAGISFLVAMTTAHSLAERSEPLAAEDLDALPSSAAEAFDHDLERFPPAERDTAVAVLSALAFAEGGGLPRPYWAPLAQALGGGSVVDDDIAHWLRAADFYIVVDEAADTYRLYHEEFAAHLRRRTPARVNPQAVITAMIEQSVASRDDARRWPTAHPYVKANLASHAVQAGRLEEYAEDPAYLVAAEPSRLLDALERGRAGSVVLARLHRVMRLAHHSIRAAADPGERASYIQLAARRLGETELADRLADLPGLPWRTLWTSLPPDLSLTLGRHSGVFAEVRALAVATVDGQPVVVSGSADGVVRRWDVAAGVERPPALGEADVMRNIECVLTADVGGETMVVAGDNRGKVYRWDLSTGAEHDPRIELDGGRAVAGLVVAGDKEDPVLVVGHATQLSRWRLRTGEPAGAPEVLPGSDWIKSLAVAPPWLLVGRADGTIDVLDLDSFAPAGEPLRGHTSWVTALATGELRGAPIAVSGGDETIRIWDLVERRELGPVIPAAVTSVRALCIAEFDGEPTVLCASEDLSAWSLVDGTARGSLMGHEGSVCSVAVAGDGTLVSGGFDGTVRTWDASDLGTHARNVDLFSATSAVAVGELGGCEVAVSARGEGRIAVRELTTGAVRSELTGPAEIKWWMGLALEEIGGEPVLVAAGSEGSLCWLDLADGRPVVAALRAHREAEGSSGTLIDSFATISVAGRRLAVTAGGQDRTIRLWDLARRTSTGPSIALAVRSLAAARRAGRPALLATMNDSVLVWDAEALLSDHADAHRSVLATPPELHNFAAVCGMEFDGESCVVTGGEDRTVWILDESGQLLRSIKLDTWVTDLADAGPGKIVVAGNMGLVALQLEPHPGS